MSIKSLCTCIHENFVLSFFFYLYYRKNFLIGGNKCRLGKINPHVITRLLNYKP